MSVETDVVAAIQAVCPRVYPGQAPVNATTPFVTYEHVAGDSLRYMDGSAASKRIAQLQVDVWHTTKAAALTLALAVEDALCAAAAFSCSPVGGLRGRTEDALEPALYRSFQEYQVLGTR